MDAVSEYDKLIGVLHEVLGAGAWSDCVAHTLNAGYVAVQNNSKTIPLNTSINYPSILIQCVGKSSKEYASLVRALSRNTTSTLTGSLTDALVHKDNFLNGTLMIAFILCSVCVGSWMLLLVLLLLPDNNHNHRKKLVYLGALYLATWYTVILTRTVSSVFSKQYKGNYQNSDDYRTVIVDSNLYKIMSFFASLICDLNWVNIIYYMFHNYRESQRHWVPRLLNNKNKQIMVSGLTLTFVHALFVGLRLWYNGRGLGAMAVILDVIRFAIYTLFAISVCYYVWHDFGFTLAPKRAEKKFSTKDKLLHIWKDYHETIPLLLYNAVVVVLVYICHIALLSVSFHVENWMGNLLTFLKLLITVNVWGLIGVLERRERTLSKETVLGRKINNKDRFFIDPKLNYDEDDCFPNVDDACNVDELARFTTEERTPLETNLLKRPKATWKSRLKVLRRNKLYNNPQSGSSSTPSLRMLSRQ